MAVISTVLFVQAISILRDVSLGFSVRAMGAMFLFLLAVIGSPLGPLLGDERMLEIRPTGLSTTIGKKSGEIAWNQVAQVASEGQRVYIVGKNGDSFVVPFDAFSNDAERNQFIELSTRWLHEARAS